MVSPHKEDDELPDKNVARDFYAKYEPKEVLGRYYCFLNKFHTYKFLTKNGNVKISCNHAHEYW